MTQNEQQHPKSLPSAEVPAIDEPPQIESETTDEPNSQQEAGQAPPMLDVDAHHEALYTWKGF